ncbi:D-glycero-alpha-D-manno-heptose-1,7-bisphosphate 7-phosphatase [Pontibacter silvestris]|uniref:D,D-heptose 1,7-bisphosphate phosphatase n=1 Tax=Pontibacter silvestris TaxID=2305183 RepID=A0ABW4WUA0_9BACT|nr:HAD family hydrolase [Pontibacter silvestris]MCC9136139.1 HAD family hydrolase [Pontibacter silvestris]
MQKQKCVFLDRDGVLNRERGDYTYRLEDFEVLPGVREALGLLKENGFLLIVVTNQGGIAKGLYTKRDTMACHQKLQDSCGSIIDAIYYAPGHHTVSASLSRKPDSLMLERAIAKYNIDPAVSWMVGDALRDMEAGKKAGVKTILVGEYHAPCKHDRQVKDLWEAAHVVLSETKKPA